MYCSKCGVPNSDEAKFCKDCGNALGVQQNPTASQAVLPASLVQRFVHNIVDGIAMYIFAFAVGFIAIAIFGEDTGYIIGLIAFFAYHLIFEATFQKTIGKMFTGTKVVSVTGEKPSFLALLGRTFARYIPFEPLSFLFYGSYPTLGWHDRLSGTLVVPKGLTPEQVRSIDQKKIDEQKLGNSASIILIIVVGGFFFIAVIGILASVVLASLNTARDKGEDASTKATLSSVRAQAELYYDGNSNSYKGFCLDTKTKTLLTDIEYTCNDAQDEYAVSSSLNENGYFCIDNLGTAKEVDTALINKTNCSGISTQDTVTSEDEAILYTSTDDNFSVMLPTKPQTEVNLDQPTDDPTLTYDMRSYQASDGTNSFFVYTYTYSDPLDLSDPDELLASSLNSIVDSSPENKLISSNYSYKLGNRAMEFKVDIEGEEVKGVFILTDESVVYLLMYNYFPTSYNQKSYDDFINSFKLN